MEELERWRDDAVPDYALAKRAHAQLGPDAAQLGRMLAHLQAASSGARPPHRGALGLGRGWLWLVPLLGLLAAAAWRVREWPRPEAPAARTSPARSAARIELPAPPASVPAPQPSQLASVESAPVKATRAGRAPRAPSDPVAELALLDRARRILAHDPARALTLTDEHRRTFSAPSFAEERELLAIEALLGLGRRTAAERRARTFAHSYPNSVHSHRLGVIMQEAAR